MVWLSLTIAGPEALSRAEFKKKSLKILVPKKAAKLAVRRNRLRRLIKEALRLEFRLEKGKFYTLRVLKDPGEIGLTGVKEAIHGLWTSRG